MTGRPLDLYDVAYLAGGPDRVIDTAVVALVESGRVRVHAPGELAVVDPGRRHVAEGAVMDAIGTHGHRSIDTVRWRLSGDERIAGIGLSLADSGLLRRRVLRHRSGDPWAVTAAGREALRHAREQPATDHALDGGSAARVAVHGREAMHDARRRVEIFERPLPPLPRTSGMGRRIRNAGLHDPGHAALLTQRNAIGGAAALGFLEGGGGDGGAF